MRDKYFTFLYIPVSNAEPRTLRVRRALVYALAAVILTGVGVATWTVAKYSGKIRETYRLATLEKQNEQLKTELDAFSDEIVELKRQIAQNFDFQKKARILAQLDDISDDVTEVGVGGPDYTYIQSVSHLDADTREKMLSARGDLDKLLRQARLQKESYGAIIGNLKAEADRVRSTPSLRPVNVGFLSSRFGRRMDPFTGRRTMHRGVDFSARKGTPVFAPADGVVTFSGTWKTYGKVVEISHGYGFVTRYAHLEKQLVRKGQKVKRGDIIARVGMTGKSTFSHLHYEVECDGQRVDPLKYVLAR
jgi:murein DD-endopeptidase MepM/ murein hydrolase activator NlpD